jgi:hypothetical protein
MLLSELAFPITITSTDGWVGFYEKPADIRNWSKSAIRKYSALGLLIADAEGELWESKYFHQLEHPSFIDRIRTGSRTIAVAVEVTANTEDPLTRFKARLQLALNKDCDLLTQFAAEDELRNVINTATSVTRMIVDLRAMRAI